MEQKIVLKKLSEFPYKSVAMGTTRANLTGLWRYWRPYFQSKRSPCDAYCPAGNHVVGFIQATTRGDRAEAAAILLDENPLPALTGRLCSHPCETHCNRREYDTAIAIQSIERTIADLPGAAPAFPASDQPRTAAVVGSGPEELTVAYFLARLGHKVTLIEGRQELGGVLRYGVPEHELPKDVLDADIARVLKAGVEVRYGYRVGVDVTVDELEQQYDLVFAEPEIARGPNLRIPGEDAEGVMSGLELLRWVHDGEVEHVNGRVAIVGGGNLAVTAGRALAHLGAEPVILYRRSREEMPADASELAAAEAEGVRVETMVQPLAVVAEAGHVVGLSVRRTQPREEGGGAAAPETWPFDLVVGAVGEPASHGTAPAVGRGKSTALLLDARWRGLDPENVLSRIQMAGGRTVSAAKYREVLTDAAPGRVEELVSYDDLHTEFFEPASRVEAAGVQAELLAAQEAARCFSCGVCNDCDNCWLYCPDLSVSRDDSGYHIDYEYCKGCTVCAAVCPRGVISIIEEKKWNG